MMWMGTKEQSASYPVKKLRCLPRIQAYMPMRHDRTRNTYVAFNVKIESKLQHLGILVENKTKGLLALRRPQKETSLKAVP